MTGAYAAGALSREDTMAVVCSVMRRTTERPKKAEITFVSADAETAKARAEAAPAPLAFLGEIGPRTAMLVGAAEDATANREFLAANCQIVRAVQSEWTYHTMLAPFDRQKILNDLAGITPGPLRLPYYPSVIGGRLGEDAILDGLHWYWGLGQPVYYHSAAAAALRDGFRVIVHVSADALMKTAIQQTADAVGVPVHFIDSMRAGEAELATWRRAKRQLRGRPSETKRRRRLRDTANETGDALARRLVLMDPDFVRDPNPYLERLRNAGPVHYLPRQGEWLAVSHEAVRSVLMNPEDYSNREMVEVDSALLGADGQAHLMARRLLARMFSADAVRSAAAYAEEAASRLLSPSSASPTSMWCESSRSLSPGS